MHRNKNIDLESLLDRDLLSRSILGMSNEIHAPTTIFTPRFIETTSFKDEVWLPLESYDHEQRPVPPFYNQFCDICREAFLAPIIDSCESANVTAAACPYDCGAVEHGVATCLSRPAPCSRMPQDWSQCPYFVVRRSEFCRCYASDTKMIAKMKEAWGAGKLGRTECTARVCWAGLQERAYPIIIHEHLAGIAMTGQFILRDTVDRIDLDRLLEENELLRPHRRRLRRVLSLLTGTSEPRNGPEQYTVRFVVTGEELAQVERRLQANAKRIEDAANVRYRHDRARSEAAFRDELLGRVSSAGATCPDRLNCLLGLLERMRNYWAFRNVYWFTWNSETKAFFLIVKTSDTDKPAYVSIPICQVPLSPEVVDCHPWLYQRRPSPPADSVAETHLTHNWMREFERAYECAGTTTIPELANPEVTSHFFVLVPHGASVHMVVFAERDGTRVSPLRPADKGSVSHLCQRAIGDTCESAVRAYFALQNIEILQRQGRSLTIGAIGTALVHDVRRPLLQTSQKCERFEDDSAGRNVLGLGEAVASLRTAISESLPLYNYVQRFMKEGAPELTPTKLYPLLDKAIVTAQIVHLGIKPQLTCDRELSVEMDECLVRVAVANVLGNIKMHAQDVRCVMLAVTRDGARVVLRIEDDGAGFDVGVLSEFDAVCYGGLLVSPAVRLGMGLGIAKAVMDLHHGSLRIGNNAKGGGWVEMRFYDTTERTDGNAE